MNAPIAVKPSKLSDQEFRDVVGRFASGVTVITTNDDTDYGSTASAVTSLSTEPPMVIVCLNKTSTTAEAVVSAQKLAVNILAEDHAELASKFARKGVEKFGGVEIERDEHGSPLLVGALAHLTCTVVEQIEAATHYVFLCHVDDGVAIPGHPLAYFRGAFGRMQTAPDASVLRIVRDRVLEMGADISKDLDYEEIAEELNAEPGLVHRALGALAAEGLVSREQGRFVLPPVPEHVLYDHYAAKLTVEVGAAHQTVGKVSKEQIAELRRLMEATVGQVDGDTFKDPEAWILANNEFHEFMISMAGSRILSDTYRRLGLPGLERRTITANTQATEELIADHRAIVKAYESEDLELLLNTLRNHAERPRQTRAPEAEAPGA